MDPISFLVTMFALYGLLSRAPGLIGEALAEWEHARRGEVSQAAADRRQRLLDAGIDPATGGAARQFAGNWWRDFWQDRDAQRAAARAGRQSAADPAGPSWRDRLADRIDTEVERRAARWRSRDTADRQPPVSGSVPPPAGGSAPGRPAPEPPPGPIPNPTPRPEAEPTAEQEARRPPIQAEVISFGPPIHEPTNGSTRTATAEPQARAIEGGPMSGAVATREVTGVASGSAAARAVQREVAIAAAAFTAEMARATANIGAIGVGALSNIQLDARSRAVGRLQQAAEAMAAARADALRCASEVSGLMSLVASEFDRIS